MSWELLPRARLIASFHDYQQTPNTQELQSVIGSMEKYSPAIMKVSTLCSTPQNALRLLTLQLELKARNQKHIVLGMGEFGLATRVFGSLWSKYHLIAPEAAKNPCSQAKLAHT